MSRALSAQKADCVFFPSVYTYVPLMTSARVAVCIHDVIPERWPALVFPTRRGRMFWRAKMAAALWQSSGIITVSEHSRAGIAETFRRRPDQILVVPEAPAAAFTPAADAEAGRTVLTSIGMAKDARFFLYVGGLGPHKNVGSLIDAVDRLRTRPEFADISLVIV